MLDFEKILRSNGMNLGDLIEEEEKEQPKETKKQPIVYNPNNIMELLAQNNFGIEDEQEEPAKPEEPVVDESSENEMAPMSALVDEEPKKTDKLTDTDKKNLAFKRSLVDASSASEDERGWNGTKNAALSSEEEMIETTKQGVIESEMRDNVKFGNYRTKSKNSEPVQDSPKLKSTLTNSGLILQIPGLMPRPDPSIAPKEHKTSKDKSIPKPYPPDRVGYDMTPDSLLFRHNEPRPQTAVPDPQVTKPQSKRPQTATNANRINYRGVWIDSEQNQNGEDSADADNYYFNSQREIIKQRLKSTKSNEFGDIDSMKMENLGVELVDGQKLVKVEREWDDSMGQYDQYVKKQYKEDEQA